jgi:hypothetical protein
VFSHTGEVGELNLPLDRLNECSGFESNAGIKLSCQIERLEAAAFKQTAVQLPIWARGIARFVRDCPFEVSGRRMWSQSANGRTVTRGRRGFCRFFVPLLGIVGWLASTLLPAAAEVRLALVIGNGKYDSVPALDNPSNDAADLTQALRSVGFDRAARRYARGDGQGRARLF